LKNKLNKKIKITIILLIVILTFIIASIIYEFSTHDNMYYKSEKNLKIPIFVYHDIVDTEDEIEFEYMQTTKETFEKQMVGLMKLGYKPITYQDLIDYNNGEKALYKHSFILTFDDGNDGVYENAFPIAKKYNIPMTSFVINYNVGTPGYFTWEQAKEMQDSGLVEICSHSLQHIEYDKVTPEELEKDITTSLAEIKDKLQADTKNVFCYPYGLFSQEGQQKLKDIGIIQNLTDNRINESEYLNLYGLHRSYPLSDSILEIILKIEYRTLRYGG